MQTNLQNLTALVAEHRREKKRGQYPTVVWDSVSALRKEHTVDEIARATGIAITQIYRKTGRKRRAIFQEVKLVAPRAATKSVVVEVRRVDGVEVRFRIEATAQELSGIFTEFLR
jgi:hypothetical protein